MARCFLALGSNLGDRQAYLQAGINEFPSRGIKLIQCSSVYATEPVGKNAQPWFLNTVVEVTTKLQPEELLGVCLEIEKTHFRIRRETNGPRTLDIDIILFGDLVVGNSTITIPHPRYAGRRFVLEPLAEIAAEVIDPQRGQPISEIITQLTDSASVERYAPPLY